MSDEIKLDSENWVAQLDSDTAGWTADTLGDLDREAFFEGLVLWVADAEPEGVSVQHDDVESALGPDAPLLLPYTRIFVKVGSAGEATIPSLVGTLAMLLWSDADERGGFIGISAQLVYQLAKRISRLDPTDAEVVRTVARLARENAGTPPPADFVAVVLRDRSDIAGRLSALVEKGVLREDSGGYRVVW
jgi:hypothetical protein